MKKMTTPRLAAWLSVALTLNPAGGFAQDSKTTGVKAEVVPAMRETTINQQVFAGNEARIAAMNSVQADCSQGPIPDLRIATAPSMGEFRLEEITIAIDRKADDRRANCNGMPLKAVGVFYKSKPGSVGQDTIVIDVDFKNGDVRRFSYKITVR